MAEEQKSVQTRFVYGWADVDATDIAMRNDFPDVRRQVESVIVGLNGPKGMGFSNKPLIALKLARGFQARGRTAGYYGSINPDAQVHPDILHPDRAYGQLVALKVDLNESALFRNKEKLASSDVDRVSKIMSWVCGVGLGEEKGPTLATMGSDGRDINRWRAAIVGSGMAGIYRCTEDPTKGLVVIQTRGCRDSKKRKIDISDGKDRPTYAVFANSEKEITGREYARRNAARMLHDLAAALGFGESVGCAEAPDALSMQNPESVTPSNMGEEFGNGIVKSGDLTALLDTLRDRPWIVVPCIRNETDVMEHEKNDKVISLFDSVVSVRSAIGSLVAFVDGNPAKGLLVCPKDRYSSIVGGGWHNRSFDPGYETAGQEWMAPTLFVDASTKYEPIVTPLMM